MTVTQLAQKRANKTGKTHYVAQPTSGGKARVFYHAPDYRLWIIIKTIEPQRKMASPKSLSAPYGDSRIELDHLLNDANEHMKADE